MRRIRISTWVLIAIFLAALVAYIFINPSSSSTSTPASCAQRPSIRLPGLPLPGASPSCSPRPAS
ncbi:MAG: hypothetical protein LBV34_12475, partial [Nocardiopsaceae bacterium]|nr:hypothetical protein [Nocardiopsaceae bacterium]